MLVSLLKRAFASAAPGKPFEEGKLAYERGALDDAQRLLDDATKSDPHNAEAFLYAGLTAYQRERYGDAHSHFERAIAINPESPEYRYQAGAAEYMLGNEDAAWRRCDEALERDPDYTLAHLLMSRIALPGPLYTTMLSAIHQAVRPRTYIEIGVCTGKSIRLALPETKAIGVDPAPRIEGGALPPNVTLHTMKSDDYFAKHSVRDDFGGLPIDLAFIDGLHHFEYALRDFINVERHCTPRSTVLVHDWFPLNRHTAERAYTSVFFSGDVWRLALILKKYRPDLTIATVGSPPTGLGLIRNLDPGSTVLQENYDAIVAEFMALDYSVLDHDKAGTLNLFPNDVPKVLELLSKPAPEITGA